MSPVELALAAAAIAFLFGVLVGAFTANPRTDTTDPTVTAARRYQDRHHTYCSCN